MLCLDELIDDRNDRDEQNCDDHRKKIIEEIRTPTDKWENLYLAAGSADKVLLIGFKNEKLKPLTGKSLAEVAKMRGTDPENTILDLVLEDQSRVGTGLLLDGRGEHQEADSDSLGVVRLGRRVDGSRKVRSSNRIHIRVLTEISPDYWASMSAKKRLSLCRRRFGG